MKCFEIVFGIPVTLDLLQFPHGYTSDVISAALHCSLSRLEERLRYQDAPRGPHKGSPLTLVYQVWK